MALVLHFLGDPNNAVEQMYVKLNGSKVVYAGDAADTFTVAGGTYKISCRINVPGGSNSFWVRIQGATIPIETELHSSGWVKWNGMPDAGNWFWHDVFSNDDDKNATVLFTMPAGTYIMKIGVREDDSQLDVIVISKID